MTQIPWMYRMSEITHADHQEFTERPPQIDRKTASYLPNECVSLQHWGAEHAQPPSPKSRYI